MTGRQASLYKEWKTRRKVRGLEGEDRRRRKMKQRSEGGVGGGGGGGERMKER